MLSMQFRLYVSMAIFRVRFLTITVNSVQLIPTGSESKIQISEWISSIVSCLFDYRFFLYIKLSQIFEFSTGRTPLINLVPMEITKTLYVATRREWHKWLQENHAMEKEIG